MDLLQSQLEDQKQKLRASEKELEEHRTLGENLRIELERSERNKNHIEKQFADFKNESLKFKSSIDSSSQEKYRLQVRSYSYFSFEKIFVFF
jgi:hypothetical protein